MGLASVFSLNVWSEYTIGGRDIMSAIEFVAADIMLPVGGLLIALFAGWVLSTSITREELDDKMPSWAFQLWLWLTRLFAPLAILVVLGGILGLF